MVHTLCVRVKSTLKLMQVVSGTHSIHCALNGKTQTEISNDS